MMQRISRPSTDDCYFEHAGDAVTHKPGPQLWESDVPATPILDKTIQSASEAKEADLAVLLDPEVRDSDLSTSAEQTARLGRLETGVIKRIEALLQNKLDKHKREINSTIEFMVKKRTSVSSQERKDTRKAVIMEIFENLNNAKAPQGLPDKIRKAVESRVDRIASITAERVAKKYEAKSDDFEGRLASIEAGRTMHEQDRVQAESPDSIKIAELEERLFILEAVLSKKGRLLLQHWLQVQSADEISKTEDVAGQSDLPGTAKTTKSLSRKSLDSSAKVERSFMLGSAGSMFN